jgi:hypothetical protein
MTIEPSPSIKPWRRYARRAAFVLAAVLTFAITVCCAGAAYLGYDAYRAPHEERDMESFAEHLCRDLLDGKSEALYAALSADARSRYSAADLASGLAARGEVTRCDVARATFLLLLVAYVVIEDDHGRHSFDLVKEAGEWKVDSDFLHDLDSPPSHGGGGGGFDD